MASELELKLCVTHDEFKLELDRHIDVETVTAIYGPSGSGKTTLLRAIAGLLELPAAKIGFKNEVWQQGSAFTPAHRRHLAYVFQEPSLFSHLTVRQNIEYGFKRVVDSQKPITPELAISELRLEELVNRSTQTLSGGEKQRVAIARAICSNPRLLLMDEPLSALDRDSKNEILPMIASLNQQFNMPIIYVSHSLDEVARLADHLVIMEKGKVVASGDIQTMLTQLNLSLAQGGDAESLIDAVVIGHDEEFELTYLESDVGQFSVLRRSLAIGDRVRILIAARDVSIALHRQQGTSILNIFNAEIDQIEEVGNAQVNVKLVANGVPVLARVTSKSVKLLKLSVGDSVFIQAKSVAIL